MNRWSAMIFKNMLKLLNRTGHKSVANKNCIRSTYKKVNITRINQIQSIFSHDTIYTERALRLLLKYDKHLQLWNFVVYHLICIYAKLLSVQLNSFHSS